MQRKTWRSNACGDGSDESPIPRRQLKKPRDRTGTLPGDGGCKKRCETNPPPTFDNPPGNRLIRCGVLLRAWDGSNQLEKTITQTRFVQPTYVMNPRRTTAQTVPERCGIRPRKRPRTDGYARRHRSPIRRVSKKFER